MMTENKKYLQYPIDTDSVTMLIEKKYELKKAFTKKFVKTYADLQNILTDSQKKTLMEHYQKIMAGGDGRCKMCGSRCDEQMKMK